MTKANVLRGDNAIAENRSIRSILRTGASMVALGGMIASGAAMAQDADADTEAEQAGDDMIVVTGIRQSLASAQNIKRESDTVVDAITAEDIGALPDRSVTEALQRVPGIAINRFAGSNDPDHFSVEGSGVVIRGLNFVRSEFNGRTAFAAGVNGQALNFADVPSELLGSVIISKNSTADMIEGGLAGTVNLITRKPLDNNGFQAAFSAEANYGDFSEEWTPSFSGLISNTWNTDGGTFGLLVSGSFSQIRSRADGLQITNFQTRDNQLALAANTDDTFVCRNALPGDGDSFTLPAAGAECATPETAGADGFADWADTRYAPLGGQFRTQNYNRKRDGIAISGQYETIDGRTTITAEFIRSHSTNSWNEYTYETAPDLSEYGTYPLGCQQNANGPVPVDSFGITPPNQNPAARAQCEVGEFTNYSYDNNGLFQSGYITNPSNGWRGGTNNFDPAIGGGSPYVPIGGLQQSLGRRQVHDEITNTDYSFAVDSQLTDRLRASVDLHYAKSHREQLDFSVFGSTFADQELDLTGDLPVVIPHKPAHLGYTWSSGSPDLENSTEAEYFADPRFQFWRAAMDHAEDSRGTQYTLRGDLEYEFPDDSFIRRAQVGARYQNRNQTVRYSTYNWGMLSEVWSGQRPINFADTPADQSAFYEFPDFFRGQVPGPQGAHYYSGDLINDYDGSVAFFQSVQGLATDFGATPSWVPLAGRDDAVGRYIPADIQPVKQRDYALYGMLSFGSDNFLGGNTRIAGNVGLRYVRTDVVSSGTIGIGTRADLNIDQPFDDVLDPVTGDVITEGRCGLNDRPFGDPVRPGGVCLLQADGYAALQNFVDGSSVFEVVNHDYDYLLPSFNMRVSVTDELLVRFAASKVLSRPDNAYIRNYFTAGLDTSGNLTATAGEPALLPATAWQFDLTAEWYFDTVGSLTANLFYKDIKNFFFQNVRDEPFTNGAGETRDVTIRGPANFDGSGKIKGFELAYQQTYDFLPGLLSGLGVSANYTYIDSSGLPNTFLNGGNVPNTSTVPTGNLPLEQLSRHNANATVFYERGPLSMRAAYNWRSRFLLTASDVIFPYYSIFNDDTGQLDASIFYSVSDSIKVGVQGVNLLNEVTTTLQAYTGDPDQLAPRSYFMNDRRFSFIVRGQF